MTPRTPHRDDPRRGATIVLLAVAGLALLGMLALAVDLGMAFTARSEAQRVADAAALAGGSAFLDVPGTAAEQAARDRAYEYALRNVVRNEPVDSSEVTVEVLPDIRRVRVWINRGALPTWFARVLGIDLVDVGAMAAAEAVQAGAGTCLKPFAVPDLWHDEDQDDNNNHVWDEGEEWEWDPEQGDRYKKYDPPDTVGATGFGSDYREDYPGDHGRPIQLKAADPNNEYVPAPGVFLPWRIPEDPDMESCSKGGGGSEQGGAVYRRNICSCNESEVELGEPYDIEPGNMVGPTWQGIKELLDKDASAFWDEDMNDGLGGVNSEHGLASPRVVKIALFPPGEIDGSGMQEIHFNNFALMFMESASGQQDPVMARFIKYASGSGEGTGETTGSLILFLRLVE
jgi:hypothetical protein